MIGAEEEEYARRMGKGGAESEREGEVASFEEYRDKVRAAGAS